MKKIRQSFQGIGACTLGTSFKDRLFLVVYYFVLRINRKREKMYFVTSRPLSISYQGKVFRYSIANLDDYRILQEIFKDEQYALAPDRPIKTIVDLGSNVGASIMYFLTKYPDAHIYGFEPTTYCYDLLAKNVGQYPAVTLEKKAVAVEDGKTVPIYIHPAGHSGSSSFFIEGSKTEQVPTISVDSIMEKYGLNTIDILKVDIEGLEYDIFAHFRNQAAVSYILVEVHPGIVGRPMEEFLKLCPDFEVVRTEQNVFTGKALSVTLANKKR
jgi:FkbM family methyltransferase